MLRDDRRTGTDERAWRVASAAGLLGLTIAVGLLRGPALAEEKASADKAVTRAKASTAAVPAAPLYLRDGMDGVVLFRPAATLQHVPMQKQLLPLLRDAAGIEASIEELAKQYHVDTKRPGFLWLRLQDIEWITAAVGLDRTKSNQADSPHTLMLGSPAIRTVAPFDWLAFVRQWGCTLEEVHVDKAVYYRVKGPITELLGPGTAGVYLPDDRTFVIDQESAIRKLVGKPPAALDYLQGPEWKGASRGLFALALRNPGGELARRYDLGRPDDKLVIPLLKGVERWVFSIADDDAIKVSAFAVCRDQAGAEMVARAIDSLEQVVLGALREQAHETTADEAEKRATQMAKRLLDSLTVLRGNAVRLDGLVQADNYVAVRAERFATLADLAAFAEAVVTTQKHDEKTAPRSAK